MVDFDRLTEAEYEYMNLGMMVSAHCGGDYDKKMPCTQEEWDFVVNHEMECGIQPQSSLTNYLEASL